MTKIYVSASEMACAFPAAVRDEARLAFSSFPATRLLGGSFSVVVDGSILSIPTRIHNDPSFIHTELLTAAQRAMVDCLLTRHSDGLVRERHLTQIIRSKSVWVPPIVIQLVGEYVVEILDIVRQNLNELDASLYASFLQANRGFFATTEQRVTSY